MIIRNVRALAFLAIAAAVAVAGCGGGGSKALPTMPQGQLGSKVGVTFTVSIPLTGTSSGSQRTPKYLPTSTQSIVIAYIGDNPSATPVPGSTPPSTATVAATVNVTTSGTNPPPAGSCFNNAGSYICTINVQLPVGVLDFYVIAYDGQNGTGNVIANTVAIVQVSQSGALTTPGTTTAVAIVLGASPASGSVTLNAIAAIVPNGIPNPATTAPSYPSTSAPFVYSATGTLAYTGIPANTPLSGEVITDNDTSGGSCLVYIKAGATTATPCPFSTAKSSVTLTNSSDSYAVLYNGMFVPGGAISLSATGASSPLSVQITPTVFSMGSVTFAVGAGPIGTLVYDPINSTVYAGTGNSSTPLYGVTYGASGFGTPTAVNVTSVNGLAATALSSAALYFNAVSGGINAAVIGPDNNIWMIEHNGEPGGTDCCLPQYVAVAVLHSAVVNPNGGAAIQPGAGVFAEYELFSSPGSGGYATTPLHSIASMGGFIWVIDKDGGFWRINPTTGLVSPNLAPGYPPGTTPTEPVNGAFPLTDSTGANPITGTVARSRKAFFSPLVPIGTTLYIADQKAGSLDAFSVDTTATPSSGLCTPSGPPPCIATYQRSISGSLANIMGGGTDGTSLYVLNSSTGVVGKITPPATLLGSMGAYTGTYHGGVFVTSDNWLWTLTNGGVEALTSMTSSAAPIIPTAVTACGSQSNMERGAFPMTMVPNGTLVFSPNISSSLVATSSAVLCAVVY
ncbi:MAG: hypothetical protein ACRENA_01215 [Vulcanimicrobiaceae bacterium]